MSEKKLEGKQFLAIVIIWFALSYFIMWAIGGACLNPINGSACLTSNSFDVLRNVPIIGLFLPYDGWNSIMYFLAPIAGFVIAFVMINWWNNYFETKEAAGIAFLAIMVVLLLGGYAINLWIYTNETAVLNSSSNAKYNLHFCLGENSVQECNATVSKINQELVTQAQSTGAQTVQQSIPVAFWPELRQSMYLLFILGAIAAWLPLFVREIISKNEVN